MPCVSLKKKKHECQILGPFTNGEAKDVAEKPLFKLPIVNVDEFVGR